MANIPGLIVVEPSPEQSKHRAAGIFVRKEKRIEGESVKEHLRKIREDARSNNASLIEQLQKTLGKYDGVKITSAKDAKEAVSYIKQIADNTTLASINKSNIVVNELRPGLQAAGFKTYLRYYGEFNNFEEGKFQKKVEDYWSLPGMHGRNLVESFDKRHSITRLSSSGIKDYVAIMGVNAISAEDGTVYFLQHMSNITKDLQQAKKIILVVGIEKILKNKEDALFHTKSMGIYGLESILLDLIPHDIEKYDFESLPELSGENGQELHVIFYDNGRSELLKNGYSDLFLCIDCRACARQCPVGQHIFLDKGMVYSPKNYLLGSLQGWLPPVEVCLHCGRCQVECPVDIDIPTLIWKAQFEHYAEDGRSLKKKMLDDPELLAKLGGMTAPLSNWMVKLWIVKMMTQFFTGVHKDSTLPEFHRQTFRDWFKGGSHE
ncbi:MAG: LUD domain-containing protein [Proteobacteria bacterium]|nr:LUD domain-containing protein [Pseudomonadota bacterium]